MCLAQHMTLVSHMSPRVSAYATPSADVLHLFSSWGSLGSNRGCLGPNRLSPGDTATRPGRLAGEQACSAHMISSSKYLCSGNIAVVAGDAGAGVLSLGFGSSAPHVLLFRAETTDQL